MSMNVCRYIYVDVCGCLWCVVALIYYTDILPSWMSISVVAFGVFVLCALAVLWLQFAVLHVHTALCWTLLHSLQSVSAQWNGWMASMATFSAATQPPRWKNYLIIFNGLLYSKIFQWAHPPRWKKAYLTLQTGLFADQSFLFWDTLHTNAEACETILFLQPLW